MHGLWAEDHAQTTSGNWLSNITIARGTQFWAVNRCGEWKVASRYVNIGRPLLLGTYPRGSPCRKSRIAQFLEYSDLRPRRMNPNAFAKVRPTDNFPISRGAVPFSLRRKLGQFPTCSSASPKLCTLPPVFHDTKIAMALIAILLTFACGATGSEEFAVKNKALSRSVTFSSGTLRTQKLAANGVNVLDGPSVEFLIDLDYKGGRIVLGPSDFAVTGFDVSTHALETRTVLNLTSKRNGVPIRVQLNYWAQQDAPYIQKSLVIKPYEGDRGAVIRRVTLEDLSLRSEFEPVTPLDRYSGNAEHYPKADLSEVKTRFRTDADANYVVMDPAAQRGLFFFVSSLFGKEVVGRRGALRMTEETYTPLKDGFKSARATIGTASGTPEVLYKRFREFLWQNYCIARGKPTLVEYETWLVEEQRVSERKCLEDMRATQAEGYFNAFHLDYGWENHYPLTDDTDKFPKGLPYLADQARSMGLKMVYWINPLGSKGQTTDHPQWGGAWDGLVKEHPEWFATYDRSANPTPKGKDILCFTSPYADFVERKLLRLVTECGATMFYIDGNDWTKFACPPSGAYHVDASALPFVVLSRFQSMYAKLRQANPELIICLSPQVGGSPTHAHKLSTIDQIEFWDGTADGCLGDRQQRYNQAFIFPPCTMNSGWYAKDMSLPFPRAKYVIAAAISGQPQIQGTQQIAKPDPERSAYLKRFFAFRSKFARYFEVYQHALDFPDGKNVDGEGHIIDNSGFIVLYNPSDQPRKVALPLDEPGLELKGNLTLSDWTELDSGVGMGSAKVNAKIEVELAPVSARIIGVNIAPSN